MWKVIRKMNVEMLVLCSNNKNATTNAEKIELLVKAFVKIHSLGNLSEMAKQGRELTLAQNMKAMERR